MLSMEFSLWLISQDAPTQIMVIIGLFSLCGILFVLADYENEKEKEEEKYKNKIKKM